MPCPLCGRNIRVPASAEAADDASSSSAGPGVASGGTGSAASQGGTGVKNGQQSTFDPFSDLQAPVHVHGPVSDARAEKQFKSTIMMIGIGAGAIGLLIALIWGVSSIVGGGGSNSGSSGSSSGGSNPSGRQNQPEKTTSAIGLGGGEGESGTAKSGRGRGGSDRGHGRGAADEGKETGNSKGPPTRTENQSKNSGTDEGTESESKVSEKAIAVDEAKLAELRKDQPAGEAKNFGASLPEDGLNVPSLAPDLSSILKRKGSGGFGARGVAGRAQRLANGASADVERAIEMGVRWLVGAQSVDGHWDSKAFGATVANDLGVTGLCLLVLLGEGHHPASKTQFSAQVDRGVNWVLSKQNTSTGAMNAVTFYEQGISLMVLSEAYALTKDEKYKEPAQKLLDFIVSQSSPNGGYGYGGAGADTSVTGFQIMGIKSAMMAGLTVPEDAVLKVHTYLKVCTLDDGQAGYTESGSPRISMTSVAMCCRLFLGYGLEDGMVVKAADLIAKNGPKVDDEYFTYYATYCMFQVGGPKWREWNRIFRPGVIALQEQKAKGLVGSFNPSNSTGAANSGRVYATAMYLLTLQVYARFLPMYR